MPENNRLTQAVASAGDSEGSSGPATFIPASTRGQLRGDEKAHRSNRIVRAIVWLVVILVVILLSLLISAWIANFRFSNGLPDVVGMINWIFTNYHAAA